jgi:hypothetical protein
LATTGSLKDLLSKEATHFHADSIWEVEESDEIKKSKKDYHAPHDSGRKNVFFRGYFQPVMKLLG